MRMKQQELDSLYSKAIPLIEMFHIERYCQGFCFKISSNSGSRGISFLVTGRDWRTTSFLIFFRIRLLSLSMLPRTILLLRQTRLAVSKRLLMKHRKNKDESLGTARSISIGPPNRPRIRSLKNRTTKACRSSSCHSLIMTERSLTLYLSVRYRVSLN